MTEESPEHFLNALSPMLSTDSVIMTEERQVKSWNAESSIAVTWEGITKETHFEQLEKAVTSAFFKDDASKTWILVHPSNAFFPMLVTGLRTVI